MTTKQSIHKERLAEKTSAADALKDALSEKLKYAMVLAQEKGASTWLTSLPLKEFGFSLHKGAFRDALALRYGWPPSNTYGWPPSNTYGWPPSNTPTHCECGAQFTVDHALSCPKGGFPSIRT